MADPENPTLDERLIMPGARAELLRGALIITPPGDEPHGTPHFGLADVLGAHVVDGDLGAVDMLTRAPVLGERSRARAPAKHEQKRERDKRQLRLR